MVPLTMGFPMPCICGIQTKMDWKYIGMFRKPIGLATNSGRFKCSRGRWIFRPLLDFEILADTSLLGDNEIILTSENNFYTLIRYIIENTVAFNNLDFFVVFVLKTDFKLDSTI